jgi:hypothetical protein
MKKSSTNLILSKINKSFKKLWRLRYRFYSLLILMIITPFFVATGANVREEVSPNQGFQISKQNLVASWVERDQNYRLAFAQIGEPEQILVVNNIAYIYDRAGNLISSGSLSDGFASQYLSGIPEISFQKRENPINVSTNPNTNGDINFEAQLPPATVIDQPQPEQPTTSNTNNNQIPNNSQNVPPVNKPQPSKSLDEVVKKPAQPVRTNWVSYPKYKIQVPLIYTTYEDLYNKNPDGSINFTSPIDQGPIESPVQQKLKDGVVHLAYTPLPGEVGNSYIVGHSSNFSSVKSAYNRIFKPIESVSRPGEEFFVYDQQGRELKFCVFDALKIAESDVKEAFKTFGDRRVVTLQTSILGVRNGRVEATHRWLTRGELCN